MMRVESLDGLARRARRSCLASCSLPAGRVAAGAGLSVSPTFPATVTVGQTGIAASITITNNNTPPDVGSTVCRHDDSAPGPLPECFGADGILLTPSCGAQSPLIRYLHCCPEQIRACSRSARRQRGPGAVPDVTFTTVPLNDDLRQLPVRSAVRRSRRAADARVGVHDRASRFDVLKMPTLDRQAAVPGMQTAQIAIASAQTDYRHSRERPGDDHAGHRDSGHADHRDACVAGHRAWRWSSCRIRRR